MAQTLEELREENARLEAATAEVPQTEAEDVPDLEAEEQEGGEQGADLDEPDEGSEVETESWMKGDDQESPKAGKKFTDSDIGAAKAKLRAKLEREHQTEANELRQKIAQLEQERQRQQVPQVGSRPTREQFYDKDDPESAYEDALVDWKMNQRNAQQLSQSQQYEQERQRLEAKQRVDAEVDQHYERAAKLAAKSGITPDLYKNADEQVLLALDAYAPGAGEVIRNSMIAVLGEGSERVMYNLGVSKTRRDELVRLLREDGTGLKATAYLGRLSAELAAPAKRTSTAPAPATSVKGNANTTEAGRALHRKYAEAHKSNDRQRAFDLKREAKAKGVDTNSW